MLQIEEKLAQDILNYLASKPYAEVYSIIGQLQMIKSVVQHEKAEDKEK